MQGLMIDPSQGTATPAEGHPADVVTGTGHVIHSHNLDNGDTLFYRYGSTEQAWTFVNGRRFAGTLFLAGGHTTIDQFKQWFSFGHVEGVINKTNSKTEPYEKN